MNARYWHEKDRSEESLQARLKATGGMASPEIWNKLNQGAKVKLVEALEATSACMRSGSGVVESIGAGNKPPHGAASVDSRPRGDVPSFVSSAQYHDLQDHGHEMTGGFESFLAAQDGATMAERALPCVPRMPVEADELPARAYHDPKVRSTACGLEPSKSSSRRTASASRQSHRKGCTEAWKTRQPSTRWEKSAKRKKIRKNVANHERREAKAAAVATTVEERTNVLETGFANVAKLVDVLAEPQHSRRKDEEELRKHEELCNSLENETGKESYFCALRPEGIWPGFSKITIGVDFPMQPPGKHTPTEDHSGMVELLPSVGYGATVELGPLMVKRILDRVNRRLLKRVGDVIQKRMCHVRMADRTSRRSIQIRDGVLPPRCRRLSDFIVLLPIEEANALKDKGTPPIDFPPISVRYLDLELPPRDVVVEVPPTIEEFKKMKSQLESAIDQSSRPIGNQGEWWQG